MYRRLFIKLGCFIEIKLILSDYSHLILLLQLSNCSFTCPSLLYKKSPHMTTIIIPIIDTKYAMLFVQKHFCKKLVLLFLSVFFLVILLYLTYFFYIITGSSSLL